MGLFSWQPFTAEQEQLLESAIAEAEKGTSGEIRLHIDRYCKTDALYKARNIFAHLKMHETEERNGVLIYLALDERKFAVVGDQGIHNKVGDGFWEEEKELLLSHFKQKAIIEGLQLAIAAIGKKLSIHFPSNGHNNNELSNEISFGQDS
jgi:uncharacterized membrane protein